MAALEVVLSAALMLPLIAALAYAGLQACKVFFSVVGAMLGSPYL